MISVDGAKTMIWNAQQNNFNESIPVNNCLKRVLSGDFLAPFSLPRFASAAMDGYALRFEDTAAASADTPVRLKIVENIPAGSTAQIPITSGCCARIMTGAMLPEGANCVVMQEHVHKNQDTIAIQSPQNAFSHIRKTGEEFQIDDVVFKKSTLLTPAHAAVLASFGQNFISVVADPKITIIPTGSELLTPGANWKAGQIYESSALGLSLALQDNHFSYRVLPPIPDNPSILKDTIQREEKMATHILLCGGVSVGDADYNKSVLDEMGYQTLFWKVAQKPGKPFYYGRKAKTQVFGLPGNPVSTMICFHEYVLPALKIYRGVARAECPPVSVDAKLCQTLKKPLGRTEFIRVQLKGTAESYEAYPLSHQASHRLSSLTEAQGWIVAPAEQSILQAGENVTIHKF